MVADHPLLGIGWGAFKFVYPVYNELIQQAGITIFHAHNMYLNILAETGIAGFCAFGWLFFGAGVCAVRFLRKRGVQPQDRAMALMTAASILAVAISSFSDYDLFSTQISLTLWFLLGLFSNMREEYGKREKKSLRNNSQ
jgi:O-antigen ligase